MVYSQHYTYPRVVKLDVRFLINQTLVILKMKPDGRQLLNYSQVPNNRPHPPLIVNSSIFFPPRTSLFQPSPLPLPLFLIVSHFCTHFECKWPFPPYSIKKKKNCVVQHNYYELRKHETHVVSVRSHSGYVYSINICNENDYKTFWTHLCN